MDWATATPITAMTISLSTFVYAAFSQKQTRADLHHKAEGEYVVKLALRTEQAEARLRECEVERADFRARINALEDSLHAMKLEMHKLEDRHHDEMVALRISVQRPRP